MSSPRQHLRAVLALAAAASLAVGLSASAAAAPADAPTEVSTTPAGTGSAADSGVGGAEPEAPGTQDQGTPNPETQAPGTEDPAIQPGTGGAPASPAPGETADETAGDTAGETAGDTAGVEADPAEATGDSAPEVELAAETIGSPPSEDAPADPPLAPSAQEPVAAALEEAVAVAAVAATVSGSACVNPATDRITVQVELATDDLAAFEGAQHLLLNSAGEPVSAETIRSPWGAAYWFVTTVTDGGDPADIAGVRLITTGGETIDGTATFAGNCTPTGGVNLYARGFTFIAGPPTLSPADVTWRYTMLGEEVEIGQHVAPLGENLLWLEVQNEDGEWTNLNVMSWIVADITEAALPNELTCEQVARLNQDRELPIDGGKLVVATGSEGNFVTAVEDTGFGFSAPENWILLRASVEEPSWLFAGPICEYSGNIVADSYENVLQLREPSNIQPAGSPWRYLLDGQEIALGDHPLPIGNYLLTLEVQLGSFWASVETLEFRVFILDPEEPTPPGLQVNTDGSDIITISVGDGVSGGTRTTDSLPATGAGQLTGTALAAALLLGLGALFLVPRNRHHQDRPLARHSSS